MPLDAICLAAVKEELAGRITGLKIDNVQQPERDIVILALRGGKISHCRLLISAGSGDMRVHLTEHRFENPQSPPMFCMLLRKHLIGSRIISVTQPSAERVIEIALESPDAMGIISEKRLIIELIQNRSNIILVDNSLIIDCLRRVSGDFTGKRAVLPGLLYIPPPAQAGKTDPFTITGDDWQGLFDSDYRGGINGRENDKPHGTIPLDADMISSDGKDGDTLRRRTVDEWLLARFMGLSPLICRELSWRAYGDTDFRIDSARDGGAALRREFFALMQADKSKPWVLSSADNARRDFTYTRIMQYEGALNVECEESYSVVLDDHYTRSAQLERIKHRAAAALKTVKTARDRLIRKLTAQRTELGNTANREELRECGDIITANFHMMKKGIDSLIAQDFYSHDGALREIKLDPRKTPQQNAAKYYKDYGKAKHAQIYLADLIKQGENELLYLESVLGEIALIENESDIAAIHSELVHTGYIKERKTVKGKQAETAPIRFMSSAGLQILAGRNNTQNDILTLKTAMKSDVWMHVQKIHGAHVVLTCNGSAPDEQSLREAAAVAAYYSSARSGGKTPVDYTLVRHVKKPPGGRPGAVVYTDYKTIIVSPDKELIMKLKT